MKCPDIHNYRSMMYDTDRQEIEASPTFPAGVRLDKRVQKPREIFYTTQCAGVDYESSHAPSYSNTDHRQLPPEKDPFLPRNTRDRHTVSAMAQQQRPKSKRYK